jgi:hypothetical protein
MQPGHRLRRKAAMALEAKLEALLKEYEQLKEEIRIALDVYGKVYSPLVAVAAVMSGLVTAINVPKEQQGLLYALIPVLILGILGVVLYGHEIALRRLSARLEVVEYHISMLTGQPDLLSWQSHWESIGRGGLVGKWQRLLALLAFVPSVAIYWMAAWKCDPWWVEVTGDWLPKHLPFAIQMLALGLVLVIHELLYMRRLDKALKTEVQKHKEEIIDASVNHNSNTGA